MRLLSDYEAACVKDLEGEVVKAEQLNAARTQAGQKRLPVIILFEDERGTSLTSIRYVPDLGLQRLDWDGQTDRVTKTPVTAVECFDLFDAYELRQGSYELSEQLLKYQPQPVAIS